jgi:hypothetical protein
MQIHEIICHMLCYDKLFISPLLLYRSIMVVTLLDIQIRAHEMSGTKCFGHAGLLLNADDLKAGPFLREGILSLDGLSLLLKPASQPDDSRMNSSTHQSGASQSDPVPTTNKKPGRPKWLKR